MDHLKVIPEVSSRPLTASLPPSKQRQALILRCQKVLFSAYRADQYADAEGFMTSLGAVLEQFPDEIIIHVTDPRTGIQRRSKWPPTISEVIEACEDHQAYLEKLRRPRPALMERSQPLLLKNRPPGSLATIFVPEGHHRYANLVAWTETADPIWWKYGGSSDGRSGLWVSLEAWQSRSGGVRGQAREGVA